MSEEKCPHYNPMFSGDDPTQCSMYLEQGNYCGMCKRVDMYRCLRDVGKKTIHLSHSSIQDFLTCHRLFYIRQIMGLQVKNKHCSKPLKLGKLWDTVLQFKMGKGEVNPQTVIDDYDIDAYDVETIRSLYRAYRDLGIKVEDGYELQAPIDIEWNPFEEPKIWDNCGTPATVHVKGFYDRKYPNYFVENKLSGRPDGYLDIYFIQSQIATYFLADPSMDKCVMEVVRTPGLRVNRQEEQDETGRVFGERVYEDIMARPAYYFMGWNKAKQTYGKTFFRREFDLEEVKSRYVDIFREIWEALTCGTMYRNDRGCKGIEPGRGCDFINACRFGMVSDEVYEIRHKEIKF